MIPIDDNIRSWQKPIINYWLIGINLVIFLWEIKLDWSNELGDLINNWGIIPAQTNIAIANAFFYNSAAWIIVFWRLLSLPVSLFLHGSFSQIIGNMLFLWVFGKTVESILGHKQYLLLYLTAGFFCGIVQIILSSDITVPIIGANGAIASILGAYMIKFPQAKIYSVLTLLVVYIPVELPVIFYLFWWFIQQSFYGIGSLNIAGGSAFSNVSYWGQCAALVTGAAFMKIRQKF
ncbi:rhomboid family intramembrane serine protease [Dolichospermum sp. ST_con]|jgi:membrane associated rhomboid family serine protease|nr:rhomboid family intramembrane serine protease [Dolichospermum sp. ST_con]MDD1426444.1 rhomboid family intramembrane serine protease [Dolichospermum sp. ST_sed9]MDD1433050.1 rhomboid family intramembrane serine protease [Dolichospermum sp. ST_sed6]MDD1438727.1 rhomboid family intramembrane serine protease [Dolichospermum sp. ST_sed10]MDD1444423.1 rhomboid family intramembrane serine protease [Dolichospermum sp. ST_sed3]MDD1449629.1 rhomboid family intramembrane serine protease [Dolichospermu